MSRRHAGVRLLPPAPDQPAHAVPSSSSRDADGQAPVRKLLHLLALDLPPRSARGSSLGFSGKREERFAHWPTFSPLRVNRTKNCTLICYIAKRKEKVKQSERGVPKLSLAAGLCLAKDETQNIDLARLMRLRFICISGFGRLTRHVYGRTNQVVSHRDHSSGIIAGFDCNLLPIILLIFGHSHRSAI